LVEQIAAGTHTVQINLPPSINKLFNYIEIVPFPVFGVTISGVEYQDASSKWNTIYEVGAKDYKFYNNSGPLVMHLAPKETNGVFRITCGVDSEIGVIGFSNVDFGLIDYLDNIQTVYFKFENVPASSINLNTISIDFYINDSVKADKYITELAITNTTDGSGSSVPIRTINTDDYSFGGQSIDATNGLYFKVVMKEINRTSPVFRGCKLAYEV
jgi:hypothetical protein